MKTRGPSLGLFPAVVVLLAVVVLPGCPLPLCPQHPSEEVLARILDTFESEAEEARVDFKVPGMAIGIVRKEEVIFAQGFGSLSLSGTRMVDTNTVFQIGSTTKAFTAALVAKAVDEGYLTWDDYVVDYLPGFALYDAAATMDFRIRDLMAQHSGLPSYTFTTMGMLGYDGDAIETAFQYARPTSPIRTDFGYLNAMFLPASDIITLHTGLSYEEALRHFLFEPLGMTRSSATQASAQAMENVSDFHRFPNNSILEPPYWLNPEMWPMYGWVDTFAPAGGIRSSLSDMTRWLIMQMNNGLFEGNQVVSDANLDETRQPQTIVATPMDEPHHFYGMGWSIETTDPFNMIWHTGATSGASSFVAFLPGAEIGIVVLTNLGGIALPENLGRRFFDLYLGNASVDWVGDALADAIEEASAPPEEPPANPAPSLPLIDYCGTYANAPYGEVEVVQEGDALIVYVGPVGNYFVLTHWDGDTFMTSLPEESDYVGWTTFMQDQGGEVTGVTIDRLNLGEMGHFVRP